MSKIDIYNEAGAALVMPASAVLSYALKDLGIVLSFDSINSSRIDYRAQGNAIVDVVRAYYETVESVIYVSEIRFYKSEGLPGGKDYTFKIEDIWLPVSDLTGFASELVNLELTSGDDYVGGDGYNDVLHGGPGDDELEGYNGHDFLYGDSGNDYLSGMKGDDVIYGGDGDDLVDGLKGDDELWGDLGADTFCFGKKYGSDVFEDLTPDQGDDVYFDKGLIKNFKQLKKLAENHEGGVLFEFEGPEELFIENMAKKDLKDIDFNFFHF